MEISPQTSNYDDPIVATQAKNLTKAIFQHESGNKYDAVGDAGTSHGAGQWQDATWKAQAQDVLGDANAPMTPENQSVVAQGTVRKLIKEGKNAAQIAAIWNSGNDQDWQNKVGTTTINGQQIKYNVPQYVKSVTDLYQQYKGQTGGVQQPSSIAPPPSAGGYAPPTAPQAPSQEGVQAPQEGLLQKGVDAVKGVGNFLFPSVGDAYHLLKGDNEKTGLQLAGDLGSTALGAATLIPGIGEGALAAKGALTGAKAAVEGGELAAKAAPGLLATAGKNAALGAGFGVTNALGGGETDPTKIAEGAGLGAATGGLIGGAGGLISKASGALPQRIVQGVLKNSNPDVAQYALTKSLGTPAKMLADSHVSLNTLGSQLGSMLEHSGVADTRITFGELLPEVQSKYPDAQITAESLREALDKVAPLKKGLVQKLVEGDGLTFRELNALKSAVGENTFKTVFDDPTVKAGKQIGNAFYQAAKSRIVGAIPDAEPVFDQLTKEYALNGALKKAVARGAKAQALTLKDIMALMGGFTALGPLGAAGAYGLEKAATSPTVNLKAAGLLTKAVGAQKLAPAATVGVTGLLGQRLNQ